MNGNYLRGSRDILQLECLSIWRLGVAGALVHSGLLACFGRATDLLQQPHSTFEVAGFGYGLLGWVLGAFQMGSHRRATHWTCLIHRPLPPAYIMAPVITAGALTILGVVALPGAALLIAQELVSDRIVDLRHWLLPITGFMIAFSAYLAGAFAAVVRRPFAPLLIVLPAASTLSRATGPWTLGIQIIVVLWLLALLLNAFKANPDAAASQPVAIVATVPPVAMALYLLVLLSTGSMHQAFWAKVAGGPAMSSPPPGGFREAARAPAAQLLAVGSREPRHSELISSGGAPVTIVRDLPQIPRWGEMVNSGPIAFVDTAHGVRWTFSHDQHVFRGLRIADQSDSGGLRPSLRPGFERPPLQLGNGLMTDGRRLLRYDQARGDIVPVASVATGEMLVSWPRRFGSGAALLTARAIYVLTPRKSSRVALPAELEGLERVDLAPLPDGFVVSFTYGRGWSEGRGSAVQQVARVTAGGGLVMVARRSLELDYPALYRLRMWWLSPTCFALHAAWPDFLAPPSQIPAPPLSSVKGAPLVAAVLLGICSIAGTFWKLSRAGRSPLERILWGLLAAVFGLPTFLASFLFYPPSLRRRVPGRSPRPSPA
jgi:hypothetical protein